MDPSHLDELVRLEDSYWWHVAKRQLVTKILKSHFPAPGRLVEGGIGSSRNLLEFQELGYEVAGFDIMPESVEHGRQKGLRNVRQHDLSQAWPLEPASTRAVVLLDVLEHMADPVQVLKNAADVLEPNGGIVMTVPAYPWLFSDWDRSLGHYRRYTIRELRSHAKAASLKVKWVTHWNAFSFPAAVAVRGFERCFPQERSPDFPRVSPIVNSTLLTLARMERWCLQRMHVPLGLSLVGVLTK